MANSKPRGVDIGKDESEPGDHGLDTITPYTGESAFQFGFQFKGTDVLRTVASRNAGGTYPDGMMGRMRAMMGATVPKVDGDRKKPDPMAAPRLVMAPLTVLDAVVAVEMSTETVGNPGGAALLAPATANPTQSIAEYA